MSSARAASTPSSEDRQRLIAWRRGFVFVATVALSIALLGPLWRAAGGILALIAAAPIAWIAFLAVNAAVAAALIARRRPLGTVSPFHACAEWGAARPTPLRLRLAIVCCIRHERVDAVMTRLAAIRESLEASGDSDKLDFFVLSDSTEPAAVAAEEAGFAAARTELAGCGQAIYRRRAAPDHFKGGNLRDFVDREGRRYDAMAVLDADSVMDGATILAHARVLQAAPRIALLQSLILPAAGRTLYTRWLRFAAETTVRSHYLGHAWWQADAGPFGGHNALVRLDAFRDACALRSAPPPFTGPILGHDHWEAAQLSAAGWEVRLWPHRVGSWEDYPVHLMEHAGRDRRWARANLQYIGLAAAPGLRAINRFHLGHLASSPLAAVAALGVLLAFPVFWAPAATGAALLWALIGLALAPKVIGAWDVARHGPGLRAYGGPGRFAASLALDLLATLLVAPTMIVAVGLGLVGAFLGRPAQWPTQDRDARVLPLAQAAAGLWPVSAVGATVALSLAAAAPEALLWAAPLYLGPLLAVPLASLGASARWGDRARRAGLFLIPSETEPPAVLDRIARDDRAAPHRPPVTSRIAPDT